MYDEKNGNLSRVERLVLSNEFENLKKVGPNSEVNFEFKNELVDGQEYFPFNKILIDIVRRYLK